ncbi:MAG: hypothetical protein LW821_05570 [Flammeovirgaceae bacterium]|jgi:hypothetical protein|nr:hypothetical protein [Flammeovirgaceae bacterium]
MKPHSEHYRLKNEICSGLKVSLHVVNRVVTDLQNTVLEAIKKSNSETKKINNTKLIEHLQGYDAWNQIVSHQVLILQAENMRADVDQPSATATRATHFLIYRLSEQQIETAFTELIKNIENIEAAVTENEGLSIQLKSPLQNARKAINLERINKLWAYRKYGWHVAPSFTPKHENEKEVDKLTHYYTTEQERKVHANFFNRIAAVDKQETNTQTEIFT